MNSAQRDSPLFTKVGTIQCHQHAVGFASLRFGKPVIRSAISPMWPLRGLSLPSPGIIPVSEWRTALGAHMSSLIAGENVGYVPIELRNYNGGARCAQL